MFVRKHYNNNFSLKTLQIIFLTEKNHCKFIVGSEKFSGIRNLHPGQQKTNGRCHKRSKYVCRQTIKELYSWQFDVTHNIYGLKCTILSNLLQISQFEHLNKRVGRENLAAYQPHICVATSHSFLFLIATLFSNICKRD